MPAEICRSMTIEVMDNRSIGQFIFGIPEFKKKLHTLGLRIPSYFSGCCGQPWTAVKVTFWVRFAISIFNVNCTSGICEIEMLLCVGTFRFFCVFL